MVTTEPLYSNALRTPYGSASLLQLADGGTVVIDLYSAQEGVASGPYVPPKYAEPQRLIVNQGNLSMLVELITGFLNADKKKP